VTLVSGLHIPNALVDGGQVQPGGALGFHWHTNPLLTGTAQVGSVTDATVTAPSTDQLVAAAIGGETTIRNLNYRAQALFYILGGNGFDVPDNRDTISFADNGQGVITPVPPTVSPKQAYENLFLGFDTSDAGRFALRKRQSVLDLVERRTGGVLAALGSADRQRMELHYAHIRELEKRLEQAGALPDNPGCAMPVHPGEDPPLSGSFDKPTCSGGTYEVDAGYSGEYDRARILMDCIHMAFVCDLTRVATMMLSMWQCFMNAAALGGANYDVHASTHFSSPSAIEPIAAWHVDHFAYLVSRLRDSPEGVGSVLDNCALVFMSEGGNGAGPSGSESHTTENMCWMVAGGAGGLLRGEHVAAPTSANHPVNVLISAMNAVGVPTDNVGEISGVIPELFA
jgi:hypothetical protein